MDSEISIIIPTLNEADVLDRTLKHLTLLNPPPKEILIVDGGSQDNTLNIAHQAGISWLVSSKAGRSIQMNLGAKAAKGNILLFLHADTRLPAQFDILVRDTLAQTDIIAGAFALQIDAGRWSLRLIEIGVNWRSRTLQMPYGDQAIFLPRAVFEKIGGFPELPMMEDFELMRRLKRWGRIAIIPVPVLTSARRWLQKGAIETTLMNQIAIIAYLLGVSPERIKRWYRRD